MGILEAIAYNRPLAKIYTETGIFTYDTRTIDTSNFLWFVEQIQHIKPLKVAGYFVDTEFNGSAITELSAICPSNISKSVIRRSPVYGDARNDLIGSPAKIERVPLDDIVYYYMSARDKEAFISQTSCDCREMIKSLGHPRGIFMEGSTMTLSLLYSSVIGVCDTKNLHGATYDAVLLSELCDQWIKERSLKGEASS
jgi:hypothetical protein